jgi:hypothetical protein
MMSQTLPSLQEHQFLAKGIFDKANPFSVYNLVPPTWPRYFDAAKLKFPDLHLVVDERDFKKFIKKTLHMEINPTENKLRFNFWLEYDAALSEGRKMIGPRIYGAICTDELFERYMLKNEVLCNFLLLRPSGYATTMNEALVYGLKKLRDILDEPETDKKGRLNLPLLKLKLEIIKMMDARINGAPTQKIQQINANISGKAAEDLVTGDMASLKYRLEQLEHKKRQLGSGVAVQKTPLVKENSEVHDEAEIVVEEKNVEPISN